MAIPTKHKQYDTVLISKIYCDNINEKVALGDSIPKPGDIAVIVEVFGDPPEGFILECVGKDGSAHWLATFNTNDLSLKNIST